jgi:ABC-type sulfate transport system permease component
MKKTIIGSAFSIVGALLCLGVMIFVGNNLVSSWSTPPGRFYTTIAKTEMTFPFVISLFILITGLVILTVEFFKKEK